MRSEWPAGLDPYVPHFVGRSSPLFHDHLVPPVIKFQLSTL